LLSGVHGVGKTYFCEFVSQSLEIEVYSASSLIANLKKRDFNKDKLIQDIEDNQALLLLALEEKEQRNKNYILDGHLCLLNENGNITRIPNRVFEQMNIDAIVLLTDKPETIAKRIYDRDGICMDKAFVGKFQEEEVEYANEITSRINKPLFISNGEKDFHDAVNFIKKITLINSD